MVFSAHVIILLIFRIRLCLILGYSTPFHQQTAPAYVYSF